MAVKKVELYLDGISRGLSCLNHTGVLTVDVMEWRRFQAVAREPHSTVGQKRNF